MRDVTHKTNNRTLHWHIGINSVRVDKRYLLGLAKVVSGIICWVEL